MIGSIFLSVALATAVISMICYGRLIRVDSDNVRRIARASFHATVVGVLGAASYHIYLILTHQYQYTYVWEHSSNSLSTPLLIASAYAGQEGSFMLWTVLVALIGVFVIGYTQRVKYEEPVMAVWMLVLACLLVILVVKSPFMTIFASFPAENIPAGFVPPDGKGLNPQLENLWITIHPPILFTGFAAMTVPFAFAIAALIKRDYQRWISISLPWTLFASMVLGFGIMLGGWWAYETLGWGGFWAWDPVENSSLIPWLACVGLVHTMLVQKRTGGNGPRSKGPDRIGGLVKTNFTLAVSAFGLILYSTFLTRSGVLGDTSVHSFVAPGAFVYAVLLGINLGFVLLGFGLIARRWKELKLAALDFPLMSRETALGIGSAVILASAIVVLIGTSWPIFMPFFNKPKVAVPTDFYNNLHLPIAFVLVLLNGISMTLKWKMTTREEFFRKIRLAVGIALLGTIGLVLLGVHDPIYVALGFGSLLSLVVNVQIGAKVARGNPRFIGAYVSHAGVAMLMLGIIFTARYSVTKHVHLVQGEPKQEFGYKLTYLGPERIEQWRPDQEKYRYNIAFEKGASRDIVRPVTFLADFNKRESPFLEPGILYSPTRDIYVSPKAIEQEGGDPTVTLRKGEKANVPFDSAMTVRFEKFDMSKAATEGMQGAVMEVKAGDSSYFLTSYHSMRDGKTSLVSIPGTDIKIGMTGLNTDRENLSNSQAILSFQSASHPSPAPKEAITVDVSIKPFISFVWSGVIIMVGGFFFAILRRRRELFATLDRWDDDASAPVTTPQRKVSRREPIEQTIAARTAARR